MLMMLVTLTWSSIAFCGEIDDTAKQGNAVSANTPSSESQGQKRLEDMTAIEVAQNPAAYGFTKGGTMSMVPVKGSTMEPSRDEQWTKKVSNGKIYILTIHYDKDGKMVSARWGGF
jgi:hypothetical protein